jgi:NTP pyrophosphatase (non-canonical NTP hydrolase)
MEFRAYQLEALRTDQVPSVGGGDIAASLVVPMLGLAGETGQLLSEYKKHLRDGEAHRLFKERVAEELGDLLWYVANVASKFGLNLDDIATHNLSKVQERWANPSDEPLQFDQDFPESERLPRRIEPKVRVSMNGELLGSPLGDNAYDPDGYRFHDVFHLAYAAILGWSPNLRAFLKRKRKSNPLLDEVEDGGRARVLEEGVSALVFDYARVHEFLNGVTDIDYRLLRTIKSMTAHLEVGRCTISDWQRAILDGFAVWREVLRDKGGRVLIDLDERKILYLGPVINQVTAPQAVQ